MGNIYQKLCLTSAITTLSIATIIAKPLQANAATVVNLTFFDDSNKRVGSGSFSYDETKPIDGTFYYFPCNEYNYPAPPPSDSGDDAFCSSFEAFSISASAKSYLIKSFNISLYGANLNNNRYSGGSYLLWNSNDTYYKFSSIIYKYYPDLSLAYNPYWLLTSRNDAPALRLHEDSFTASYFPNHENTYIYGTLVAEEVAVPEPLTLLGAGTAMGFGAFFKRQLSKQQKRKNRE